MNDEGSLAGTGDSVQTWTLESGELKTSRGEMALRIEPRVLCQFQGNESKQEDTEADWRDGS